MNFLSSDTRLLRFPVDIISVTTQYWISLKRRMKTSKLLVFWRRWWWLWKEKKVFVCVCEWGRKIISWYSFQSSKACETFLIILNFSCRLVADFSFLRKAHRRANSLVENVYQLTLSLTGGTFLLSFPLITLIFLLF